MRTDYHCHILPGMDDGARDKTMAVSMLEAEQQQGVERIVATPHFYAHREASVEDFLKRRQTAYERIAGKSPVKTILLGAEVAVEHGISKLHDVEKLAIQGTNLILLELPYRGYAEWMSDEIHNISVLYGLNVILAHIHRCCTFYGKADMRRILSTAAYFQINHDAFTDLKQRHFVKTLIRDEYPIVFGSDCHNLTDRRPNWKFVEKGRRAEAVRRSDAVLDKHINK